MLLGQILAHIVGDICLSAPHPELLSCHGDAVQDSLCTETSCFKAERSHPDHLTSAVGSFLLGLCYKDI